jgi:hypothetical protein
MLFETNANNLVSCCVMNIFHRQKRTVFWHIRLLKADWPVQAVEKGKALKQFQGFYRVNTDE